MLPVPMLLAHVSTPSPGAQKEQKFVYALCHAGVHAREGQLWGVCASHPVTADPCPTTGLLLPCLPIVATSLV